jgi:hypothetical protein
MLVCMIVEDISFSLFFFLFCVAYGFMGTI